MKYYTYIEYPNEKCNKFQWYVINYLFDKFIAKGEASSHEEALLSANKTVEQLKTKLKPV